MTTPLRDVTGIEIPGRYQLRLTGFDGLAGDAGLTYPRDRGGVLAYETPIPSPGHECPKTGRSPA